VLLVFLTRSDLSGKGAAPDSSITVQVILAKSWQKSLNITYQVYLRPTIYYSSFK